MALRDGRMGLHEDKAMRCCQEGAALNHRSVSTNLDCLSLSISRIHLRRLFKIPILTIFVNSEFRRSHPSTSNIDRQKKSRQNPQTLHASVRFPVSRAKNVKIGKCLLGTFLLVFAAHLQSGQLVITELHLYFETVISFPSYVF